MINTRMRTAVSLVLVAAVMVVAGPAMAQEKETAKAAGMRLTPMEPLGIFAPGKEVRFEVDVSVQPAGTLNWEARDLEDRVVASGKEIVSAGGKATIRFTPREPGIVYVKAKLTDASSGEQAVGDSRAAIFAPREKPVAAAPILWSVSTHLHGLSAADAAREIELMRKAGFAACRFDLSWGAVQPERDVYKWDLYDRLFAEFDRNKVVPLPLIGYGTRWATTGDPNAKDWREWGNAPPQTAAYTNFAQQVVRRYGKYTRYWEIWNEPDIAFWRGTVEQYADLSNASVKAIKEVDPKSMVMNGGFSETKRRPDFIPRYLALANPKPDIYAFHTHGSLPNLVRAGEDTHKYLTDAGWNPETTQIWLNEAGFSNNKGGTERLQAAALIKKMAYAPAVGCDAYVWYDLRNDGTDPNENEHNFGLVRNDFSPKAGIVAAHTLLDALQGKRFVKRLEVGQGRYALLYAGNGERVLVYWNEAGAPGSQQTQLIRAAAQSARVVNMMGVEKAVTIKSGVTTAVLTANPQFLVLSGESGDVTAAPTIIDTPVSVVAAPGTSRPVTLTITNPLSTKLDGGMSLSVPKGWRVSPEKAMVQLAPGEKKQIIAEVTAPSSEGDSGSLKLKLDSSLLPQSAEAGAALLLARKVGRTPAPMATLSGRENTVSLFEATPMTELHFKGPEDLSAEVTLSHDDHNILLGVRVRDDKHGQNEPINEIWRGDSVQFAVVTPLGQHYEWMTAVTESGPRLILGLAPEKTPRGEQSTELVSIQRSGDITEYKIRIPDTLPGIREMLAQGGGINLIVNDNDGQGRKGWVEWAPGIGRNKDATLFPRVVFE